MPFKILNLQKYVTWLILWLKAPSLRIAEIFVSQGFTIRAAPEFIGPSNTCEVHNNNINHNNNNHNNNNINNNSNINNNNNNNQIRPSLNFLHNQSVELLIILDYKILPSSPISFDQSGEN